MRPASHRAPRRGSVTSLRPGVAAPGEASGAADGHVPSPPSSPRSRGARTNGWLRRTVAPRSCPRRAGWGRRLAQARPLPPVRALALRGGDEQLAQADRCPPFVPSPCGVGRNGWLRRTVGSHSCPGGAAPSRCLTGSVSVRWSPSGRLALPRAGAPASAAGVAARVARSGPGKSTTRCRRSPRWPAGAAPRRRRCSRWPWG